MSDFRRAFTAYLRQQSEIGMPDVIFSAGFVSRLEPREAPHRPAGSNTPSTQPRPAPAPPAPPRPTPKRRPLRNLHVRSPVLHGAAAKVSSSRREALKKLYFEVRSCTACPLASSRHSVVFGAGSAEAPLLIVGEAPGAEEDAQGLPFVGNAGRLLTDMLRAIGLDRNTDTFVTNVLKCRPPGNRDPETTEIHHCLPIVRKQVEIIQPKCLLLLGRIAAGALLERHEALGKLRGEEHSYCGIPTFVTYHPAALLRNADYKRPAWEDLKRLKAKLKELGYNGSAAAS